MSRQRCGLLHAAGTRPREPAPAQIIEALSQGLNTAGDERKHLFRLAGYQTPINGGLDHVRPELARLLRQWQNQAAFLLTGDLTMDYHAFDLPRTAGWQLIVDDVESGSASAEAFTLLRLCSESIETDLYPLREEHYDTYRD